ncbi:MAG: amidohydrolase family protein [Bacteroidia bacterium]
MTSPIVRSYLVLAMLLTGIGCSTAQPLQPGDTAMRFVDYNPPSTLVVPEHPRTRAKYPFIDIHNHQWRMPTQDLDALAAQMDSLNMAIMVNLSGRGWGDPAYLEQSLQNIARHQPGRIVLFTNIRFEGIDDPNWLTITLDQLERDVQAGARGLKVFKNLGMSVKDSRGERVAVDDPRLDPVWAKCGELGIPVLIHTADPFQFWQPRDAGNERWLELVERPDRYRDPEVYPPFEQIIGEQHNIIRRHPGTIFISAHLSWMGNDLARLGKLLDTLPNMYTEIGAVLAELGRQPRAARVFLIQYQDRVLFGKDVWAPAEYAVYFRVLETADEYFDYYRKRHAFWKMYGLDLPDEVLKKLYYQNALRIVPGLDSSLFPD